MSLIDVPGIENQDIVEELKKIGIHTQADLRQQFQKLYNPRLKFPPGEFCDGIL